MKYLNDYTEDQINKIMEQYGAFFAFSNQQFDEKKKEGIKYVSCGAGLICPKDNAMQLMKDVIDVGQKGRKQDIQENGHEAIIKRELINHEAYYTGDVDSTVDALDGYNITREAIVAIYNKEQNTRRVEETY